jgi:urea transport system permease protein
MAIGWGQSSLGSSWPDGWVYILGLVFILVTLFLPMGLSSLFGRAKGLVWRPRATPSAALPDPALVLEPAVEPDAELEEVRK